MIHYHVWFNLKPGVSDATGLAVVEGFLRSLCVRGEAEGFSLLRNRSGPPLSRLPRYHALVEFTDCTRLDEAMRRQAERGIRFGMHGGVVDVVTDFHVEIFETVESERRDELETMFACEI